MSADHQFGTRLARRHGSILVGLLAVIGAVVVGAVLCALVLMVDGRPGAQVVAAALLLAAPVYVWDNHHRPKGPCGTGADLSVLHPD